MSAGERPWVALAVRVCGWALILLCVLGALGCFYARVWIGGVLFLILASLFVSKAWIRPPREPCILCGGLGAKEMEQKFGHPGPCPVCREL